MLLFALLMIVVGLFLILKVQPKDGDTIGRGWLVTIASGLGVGILTGFLGVGGGFLIVPALVMFVGLPMRQAVGTSLVVIAMNSLAGFLGHLGGPAIDLQVVAFWLRVSPAQPRARVLLGSFTPTNCAGPSPSLSLAWPSFFWPTTSQSCRRTTTDNRPRNR